MTTRRNALAALGLMPLMPLAARALNKPARPEISAEDARGDLRILQRAFQALHAGVYRYATPDQIDAEFGAAQAAVAGGSTRAALYLLASRLAAAVHCGHTWASPVNQRGDLADPVFGRPDKLPLTLRWVAGRVQVTGSAAPGVTAGDELMAIDGRPMADIAAALLPLLRADGLHAGATAKRLSQLDSGPNGGAMDRLFPLRFPPQGGRYQLSVRKPGAKAAHRVTVAAVKESARRLPKQGTQWSFRVEADTAYLTLPTFAFWGSDFKAPAYIERCFGALRNVPFLVIDQRRNEGGDEAIGHALLAQLLLQPFEPLRWRRESAYERVPYDLARHLQTWDYGFFDRTGQVTKTEGRNWLLPETPERIIEPMFAPYPGRTVVLIGPQNSSAGFLFARDLKASRAATLVGEVTGGNLRGLNSGQVAWVTLPASGVAVDIPLIAHFAPEDTPDAGVQPDIVAAPSWDALAAGTDTGMEAAHTQIARWRGAEIR